MLGARVEWHHLVPKSEGGRETAAVHPICHRTVHALIPNADLARSYADPAALRTWLGEALWFGANNSHPAPAGEAEGSD